MTQPIGAPGRPFDWTGPDEPTSPTLYPPLSDPPEPPDLPAVDGERYPGLGRSAAESPVAQIIFAHHRAHDAVMQQRLDAFRKTLLAPYHMNTDSVPVAPPFQMMRPVAPDKLRHLTAIATSLKIGPADLNRVVHGRGTPDQVHRLTQRLIDEGSVPAPSTEARTLEARVRLMMHQHGLGFDCTGYVAPAFLASRGLDRAHSPLAGRPAENEDLSALDSRGFAPVSVDATRPGDIIVLDPPRYESVGHRAIVYASRDATREDRMNLGALLEMNAAGAVDDLVPKMLQATDLRVIHVDSSWGSGGDPRAGGVNRCAWWHSASTGTWAWTDRSGQLAAGRQPYDHPLQAAYRPRGEL